MTVDFHNLRNPEFKALMQREHDNAAALAKTDDDTYRDWLNQLRDAGKLLDARERIFVRNCEHRLNTGAPLSDLQVQWLTTLARRFGAPNLEAADEIEVQVGKTYTHKLTGKQVRVIAKAFTLDADMWHIEPVGGETDGKRLFPVRACNLLPLA